MDLAPYVEYLRDELATAAEGRGDEAAAAARRLSGPLEPAVRLMLLDALSAAADEITSELAPGSVELRLRSGEPEFAVTAAPAPPRGEPQPEPVAPPPLPDADESATARINLRLPEQLKSAVEQAAARERLSVNSWLVRVVAGAVSQGGPATRPQSRRSYTGWVR
jgi:hypothetical protein